MTDFDFLITNAVVLPLTGGEPERLDCGYVAWRDGHICEVAPMTRLPPHRTARRTLDAAGAWAVPGLINGHTHAAMTLFRGLADDLPLMTWLQEHIFPAEARFVNPEMVYWCARLAAAEMLLNGTTCVADSYFHEGMAAQAFREIGLRAVAAQGIIDFPAPGVPDPSRNVAHAAAFLSEWQGRDPLITPAVFCHSPYTCSPETIQGAKELARSRNAPFFIHLAETKAEIDIIRERYGRTPVEHLHRLGVLDERTVCVHCVWLTPQDRQIMADSRAGVVICPASHLKLASGVAPLAGLQEVGVPIGLGTDGPASNNRLDLLLELDLAAKVPKATAADPALLPARQVLQYVSTAAAKVLGLQDVIGCLAPGQKADLILLDSRRPHLTPAYDPASLLVYAARGADVTHVWVEGRQVVENRRLLTMDLGEAMAAVRRLAGEVRLPSAR